MRSAAEPMLLTTTYLMSVVQYSPPGGMKPVWNIFFDSLQMGSSQRWQHF